MSQLKINSSASIPHNKLITWKSSLQQIIKRYIKSLGYRLLKSLFFFAEMLCMVTIWSLKSKKKYSYQILVRNWFVDGKGRDRMNLDLVSLRVIGATNFCKSGKSFTGYGYIVKMSLMMTFMKLIFILKVFCTKRIVLIETITSMFFGKTSNQVFLLVTC